MTTEEAREAMVRHLEGVGHASGPVAAALRRVPRHLFVPEDLRGRAYVDEPLGIGEGQTVSAPHMVAIMATHLAPSLGHRVLEVGGGSGYHAAVLAELVGEEGHVWTLEVHEALARRAEDALARAGYADRVTVRVGDGSGGWPDAAPFDRISVAAAAPRVPPPLRTQLEEGGRLVIPVGPPLGQDLRLVTRTSEGWREESLGPCRFVPLVGAYGQPGA